MKNKYVDCQDSKKKGRWSKDEHFRFLQGILKHGKDWKKIVEVVGTRSGDQVRSHAQKYFTNLQKKKAMRNDREKREAFCLAWQVLEFSAFVRCFAEMQRFKMGVVPETKPVKIIFEDVETLNSGLEEERGLISK